jgi:hypothetical protein
MAPSALKPLTIVTFCHVGSRPIYRPWHVANLKRQCAKHITLPHRFVVVTDDVPAYKDTGIDAVPIWASPRDPKSTMQHWLFNYMRLGLFDPEIGGKIGERLLNLDLDMIIRENIDDIVSDPAPFKIMALQSRVQLQGGMFLVEPGSVTPNPWEVLLNDPTIIERSRKWVGSDQAVLSELFYGRVPTWNEADGVIINQLDWPRWRIFFRTGTRKCWLDGAPEREIYLRESGLNHDTAAPFIPSPPRSGRTVGGLSTRVRRYIVTRR